MRSSADAICSRMARTGRSKPAMRVIVSMRDSVSRGLFEWIVVIEPSWPVFMAWSMSRASPPRHSPTTTRSGRMRRALRTRSRMVTWPLPSMFGGRASIASTCSWLSWSSLASSMVTMRSSVGMNDDSTFSVVVLPVPVPPETITLRRPTTQAWRNRAECGVEGAEADQVVDLVRVLGELPDREERSADGQRVDHRVHAGAVGEAGVDHRRGLVDATADLAHDLVDDAPQVGLVDEAGVGALDATGPLDVDRLGPVHHDLGHLVVLEEPVDRAVAEDVVGDVLDELRLVGRRQRRALLGEGGVELLVHPPAEVVLRQALVVEDRTELVDQVVVDPLPQLVQHRIAPLRTRSPLAACCTS